MKVIRKNLPKIVLAVYMFILSFSVTYASCNPGQICNPINSETITALIQTLLEGLLKIGMPVVALSVIYCGFLFVSARGNPEKIKKAKESLMYTLLGAGILLGSWAIAQLISTTVLAL